MANWVYKLNIEDLRKKAGNEEIAPAEYMTEVVRRMRALKVAEKHKKNRDYVAELAEEGIYPDMDWDDSDDLMSEIYDWGDTTLDDSVWPHKKLCWIY